MSLFPDTFYMMFYHSFMIYTWHTRMKECDFKQRFFTKSSYESKIKWANGQHTKNMTFSCPLCKSRKWKIKIKVCNIVLKEKKKTFYINRYTEISNVRKFMIEKVDSTTSLSSEDVFPGVSFTAKILLSINQVFMEKKTLIIIIYH